MIYVWLIIAAAAVWAFLGVTHGAFLGVARKGNPLGGAVLGLAVGPFIELLIDRICDKRRLCNYCYEPIPTAAQVCRWCGEYQPPLPRMILTPREE